MGAYDMDSSALVKRYANETGSLWSRSLWSARRNLAHA